MYFLILCLILIPTGVFAVDLHNTVLDFWNKGNGLPQNSVYAITQSRDGYLWLATQEGLVRYDGVRFSLFNRKNIPALKQNYLTAILEASDNNMWLGTFGGGVTRSGAGVSPATITTHEGLADDIVNDVFEASDHSIWICTMGGLNRWKEGKLKLYTLPHRRVSSIAEGPAGTLWIGTDGGLVQMKNGIFKTYTTEDGLSSNLIRIVRTGTDGSIWAGTSGGGLIQMKNGRLTIYDKRNGLANDDVTALNEDRHGTLWVGSMGCNLQRFQNGKFIDYERELSGKTVTSIYADAEENLWIGTLEGGLFRTRKSTIRTLMENNYTWSIYEDSKNTKWIGTSEYGLYQYKNGQFTEFGPLKGLSDPEVFTMAEDHEGTLWVGTREGVNWIRNGKISAFPLQKQLPNLFIRALFVTRDGAVWIGTYGGGLARYHDGKLRTYTTRDGLGNDFIRHIFEDRRGSIWISTYGGGLCRFSNGRFQQYTVKDGLSYNVTGPIYEDADGVLWIGTIGGGLNRFERGRFKTFNTQNGLFDDKIFAILEDEKNNLWLSSNNGIFRVNRKELNAYARGEMRAYQCESFGTSEGMKETECNGGSQHSGWKMRDGSLWFPTVKGLAIVDPNSMKQNLIAPRVVMESVRADRKSVHASRWNEFEPGTRDLEFQYTGINFADPEGIVFQYKLEGFDRKWVKAETRRTAYYTNIPPRDYQFRVIAMNKDGVWNKTGAVYAFRINPYFYQTRWFLVACVIGFVVVAWAITRFRLRQLVQQNAILEAKVVERTSMLQETAREAAILEERNRIAQDLHDNLAQGLAGIVVQIDAAKRVLGDSPLDARQHLQHASNQARDSLEETRRSVRALHPLLLERSDLYQALSKLTQQLANGATVKVECNLKGTPRTLSKEVELNLLRIAQEAISNALKHSNAREIGIHLIFAPEQIELRVCDNGHGLKSPKWKSDQDQGLGLAGMQSRAEKIGGSLAIRSQNGKGTEILIQVPA
ncbi:histidine kinase [bacterium]|nr:histidine kinase [bacterium]